MHSFIFHNMFQPFVSAIIRQNHHNTNGKYTDVEPSLQSEALKIHKLTIIPYK
jgi:hypothetical protein